MNTNFNLMKAQDAYNQACASNYNKSKRFWYENIQPLIYEAINDGKFYCIYKLGENDEENDQTCYIQLHKIGSDLGYKITKSGKVVNINFLHNKGMKPDYTRNLDSDYLDEK